MDLKITTITSEEREKDLNEFEKRLNRGHYRIARDLADELVRGGVSITLINYIGSQIIKSMVYSDIKRARTVAEIFKDYNWHYWLKDKK